jgi:hypothetical protein
VKPTDRKAIGGVYSPVAKKHSTQLNIHIVGDHNQVVITPETLDLIEQRDRREQKRADDELSAIIVPTESHVPRLLKPGSFGTAIDHKGTWYVRLEGDGGVLRPADLAPGVMLKDDQSYSFEGYRVGPRYLITAAQPIG